MPLQAVYVSPHPSSRTSAPDARAKWIGCPLEVSWAGSRATAALSSWFFQEAQQWRAGDQHAVLTASSYHSGGRESGIVGPALATEGWLCGIETMSRIPKLKFQEDLKEMMGSCLW